MDSISLNNFESKDSFRIYDWVNENLLLRSQGSIFTGGDVDLIFWGVKYLELPLLLNGVQITKPRDKKAIFYEQKYAPNKFSDDGERTYRLKSEGTKFHVIASNFWILENKTHVRESSLISLMIDDEEARDNFFKEHVNDWYKIN